MCSWHIGAGITTGTTTTGIITAAITAITVIGKPGDFGRIRFT
jgi:hypothetical protein